MNRAIALGSILGLGGLVVFCALVLNNQVQADIQDGIRTGSVRSTWCVIETTENENPTYFDAKVSLAAEDGKFNPEAKVVDTRFSKSVFGSSVPVPSKEITPIMGDNFTHTDGNVYFKVTPNVPWDSQFQNNCR